MGLPQGSNKLRANVDNATSRCGANMSNLQQVTLTKHDASLACKPAIIALLNVRSIRNKGEFIADYVFEHDIDILCLTETWLTPHDDSLVASLTPDGFTFHHLPRQGRRGGGVGIMLKSSFRVDMVKPWRAGSFECLELVFRGRIVPSTLRLFVIYRPPSSGCKATPFRLFLDEFSHLPEHVSIKQTGLLILGDFNVHYGNVDDKNASDLAAILNDTNLQQHVKSATHYRDNILDLVITPVTGSVLTDVSVESLLTDHHIIVCKLVSNKPRPIRKEIIYRNISAIDKQTFARDLLDSPLVTTPADDIETLCDQYKSQLLVLINDHAPVIRRTVNVRARQPWRNDDLQRMRQNVRQAERKWRHTRLVVHRQIYTNLRDTFKQSISSAKSDYYCAKIESSSGNTKEMYHITNDLMGRTRQTVLPKCDGGPAELAESFITFFIDKIVDICSRLTTLRNLNQPLLFQPSDCHIEDPLCNFKLATNDDICSLVMKSTSAFSPDMDVLSTTVLKANIGTLAPVLTRIVNLSIESSNVPKVMKHAVVTPLLKKSGLDPDSLSNYRPISNLSFISKLLERFIVSQIRQYMVTNDIFDVFQSAYRPAHSCETALVRIQDDILVSLDNRHTVILVLLDLSAAFDTVDHRLLLDKLYRIGIRGNAHRWMHSYLSERTQVVRVDTHTSRCVDLSFGVPQGSVLGPLLFTVYCLGLDDIFKRHQLKYHMYADDTQLYVEFPRDQQVPATAATDRISLCTADVKTWMASHNLLLNEQKTEVVVIAAPISQSCSQ